MIYAIGDIHGQKTMLEDALARIEAESGPQARVVFLGDYTDRGPDARGVIELLIRGIAEGRDWITIKGNHDRMFSRFARTGNVHDGRIQSGKGWLHPALGGPMTLGSYGIDASRSDVFKETKDRVPASHLDFLEGLPLWHRQGGLCFVHAGIRPGIPLAEQEEDDLLWIRDPFLHDDRDHGDLIVHGHTALQAPEAYPNRVNLDGGAGFGRPLFPAVFEGRDCWLLTETGRSRLIPAG